LKGRRTVLLAVPIVLLALAACSDDDAPAAPAAPAVGKVATTYIAYDAVTIAINGYPQGAALQLRPAYWNPAQLTEDPQATVTQLDATTFEVAFANLDASKFIAPDADILLVVVESTGEELSGVVVLCDENGPFSLSAECSGDCVADCGLPGIGCDG
jgi:hypothetical protein